MKVKLFLLCVVLSTQTLAQQSEATLRLLERNKMFEPKLIEVADNVFAASGFQVSTSGIIVGDDGLIIIDPGITVGQTRDVLASLRKITDVPVKAIIYTHGHGDHTNSASVYYSEGVQVWARSNYGSEPALVELHGYLGGVRASNTQGFDLPLEQRIGVGIGIPPERRPALGATLMADGAPTPAAAQSVRPQVVAPTHTFDGERQILSIGGVDLELVKAPGETDDQLYVWYPKEKVIFTGDNFYQSWPNTYPLRGTARRSVRDWISSLDSMVNEGPEVVVPGHTAPMNNATEVLANYRDALTWVLEKTIEGARKNLTPDELVAYSELPDHLAELDYLQDYYGSRWGTVRDIYAQDLGWFDGDVLNLHRETPVTQAQRLADLAGSVESLAEKAKSALANEDFQGAAQLADAWSKLDPENPEPYSILADALTAVARNTFNAPARNYTFSTANRMRKQADSLSK